MPKYIILLMLVPIGTNLFIILVVALIKSRIIIKKEKISRDYHLAPE